MKYAKYILILALLAASGACTNDFEDYNTNPNKQSEGSVAPIALLEPLIYSSTNSYSSYMLSIANEISQVTVAKSTPRREHCYNLADGNFKAIWQCQAHVRPGRGAEPAQLPGHRPDAEGL